MFGLVVEGGTYSLHFRSTTSRKSTGRVFRAAH